MAVSKRTRFEVFKRDGFRCIYCGATPVNGELVVKFHADHVEPKSKGGEDDPANLVTACQDCNLGKSDVRLEDKKFKSKFDNEAQKEHAEQIREYLKVQRDIAEAKRDAEALVLEHWEHRMGDFPSLLPSYLPNAIKDVGLERVLEAVDIVSGKDLRREREQVKYFCGVIRRMRTGEPPPPPRSAEPPPKQRDANDAREAQWKIAVFHFKSYCEYRIQQELDFDVESILRDLIGSTPSKPAICSIQDLYECVDDSAWRTELYAEGCVDRYEGFKDRFIGLVEEMKRTRVPFSSLDGFYNESFDAREKSVDSEIAKQLIGIIKMHKGAQSLGAMNDEFDHIHAAIRDVISGRETPVWTDGAYVVDVALSAFGDLKPESTWADFTVAFRREIARDFSERLRETLSSYRFYRQRCVVLGWPECDALRKELEAADGGQD
jgi:hypothetical protein